MRDLNFKYSSRNVCLDYVRGNSDTQDKLHLRRWLLWGRVSCNIENDCPKRKKILTTHYAIPQIWVTLVWIDQYRSVVLSTWLRYLWESRNTGVKASQDWFDFFKYLLFFLCKFFRRQTQKRGKQTKGQNIPPQWAMRFLLESSVGC